MPLIVIRHSDDEGGSCSKLQDCRLNRNGERLAVKVGKKLLDRYGVPNIIFCSPFRRTKQTMENMLEGINTQMIEINIESKLSRYFSRREKGQPDIDPDTHADYIHESYDEFKYRIQQFLKRIRHYSNSDKIVWIITHALVYKQIARYYEIDIPIPIPFMHHLRIGRLTQDKRNFGLVQNGLAQKPCPSCGKYH